MEDTEKNWVESKGESNHGFTRMIRIGVRQKARLATEAPFDSAQGRLRVRRNSQQENRCGDTLQTPTYRKARYVGQFPPTELKAIVILITDRCSQQ